MVSSAKSNWWLVSIGVPQGLMLGPPLFPDFVNTGEGMSCICSKSQAGGGGSSLHAGGQGSYSEG